MSYNKSEFENHLKNWENVLKNFVVPSWSELPTLELYMDQVIILMTEYLNAFTSAANLGDASITPPMINNYVKLKAMPAPVKKKYSRVHIAYLIIISSLKYALSIPTIKKIIPIMQDESAVRELYESFVQNQRKSFEFITDKVESVTNPILKVADDKPERINDLVLQIAVSANVLKILSEDIATINVDEKKQKK